MKVRVIAFGIAGDIVGRTGFDIKLKSRSTVNDVRKTILTKYPQLQDLSALMIAVNAKYAKDNKVLKEADEIALIPPTNGG